MMWYVYVPNSAAREALLNVARSNGWKINGNTQRGYYVVVKDGVVNVCANRIDATIETLNNAFDIFSQPQKF